MRADSASVVVDQEWGYRRLDPVPSDSELARFYESEYYDAIRAGGRAPDLRKITAGGDEAEAELTWLRDTLYRDVVESVREHAPGKRLLDVGCGTGDFLVVAADAGLEVTGLEPAGAAAERARENGLRVAEQDLATFCSEHDGGERFDAVVLLNVLEHVPEPAQTLRNVSSLLAPRGIVWIRVPNDFNPLQAAAAARIGADGWWVCVPDHINYFDTESLPRLLTQLEFETVELEGDFPMEVFLLMGMNYVTDPSIGNECHRLRVQIERELSRATRRRIYRLLGENGIGRNVRVVGRTAP